MSYIYLKKYLWIVYVWKVICFRDWLSSLSAASSSSCPLPNPASPQYYFRYLLSKSSTPSQTIQLNHHFPMRGFTLCKPRERRQIVTAGNVFLLLHDVIFQPFLHLNPLTPSMLNTLILKLLRPAADRQHVNILRRRHSTTIVINVPVGCPSGYYCVKKH